MPLGDYSIQVSRFIPKGYWKLSGTSNETALFGSGTVSKTSCVNTYRPLTFSSPSGGMILNSSSSVTIPTLGTTYAIAAASYSMNSFTINFWYQNLSNTTTSTAIMTIGNNIKLYANDGKITLNFMGQYSYVEVRDFRDLLHISIIFDGTRSKLIVNNVEGYRELSISSSFNSDPTLTFNGQSAIYQISDLAIFAYTLSPENIAFLYDIGIKSGTEFFQISNSLNDISFGGYFVDGDKIFENTPDEVSLRNCIYKDGQFKLNKKPLATISGATWNSGQSAYAFPASASIYFQPDISDIDYINTTISVTTKGLTTGTIISWTLDNGSGLYIKYESSNLNLYFNGSLVGQRAASNATFNIDFIDGYVYLRSDGNSTLMASTSLSRISKIYIGNNPSLSDRYTGYISNVSINYKNYPLQTGKYVIDLATDYGTATTIKAKQDGVANFITFTPAGAVNNFVHFYSNSSLASVRYYPDMTSSLASNTISSYKDGSSGTQIINGDSVFSTLPLIDTPTPFAVRLADTTTGSNNTLDMAMPSVSDFKHYGYLSNTIYSDRDSTLSSATQNSIRPREVENTSLLKYNAGITPKVNTSLAISRVNSNIDTTRSIYFNLRVDSIPSSGNILTLTYSGGSVNLYLTNSSSTYGLSATGGTGTTIYVDGGATTTGLLPYVTYSIVITVTSRVYTAAALSNLSGCHIFNLGLSSSVISASQISRLAQCLFNDNSTSISGTGGTITITDTGSARNGYASTLVSSE